MRPRTMQQKRPRQRELLRHTKMSIGRPKFDSYLDLAFLDVLSTTRNENPKLSQKQPLKTTN